MGADQQFCLRWNNFHTNITSAFESLRDDEDFVDITLACEGRQIKAHKMVLSACSPYFRSLLKGNPCQHPIVFLKDVTFANLSSILDFMYHGEVNVSHNELATFLKTAEALKVRGLAEDEKKKEAEGYNESSSPPPPRDPPDPGSPRPEESGGPTDTHLSDSSPPAKRQRRRSGTSVHSAEDTNETVLSEARDSVKNEPQDYTEEEDMLGHSVEPDIKADATEDGDDRSSSFGPSESVTISRSQAAMQQLQESFGSFLPGMGQSPGFLPHGASDMPRPPPFPLEGVQGLPPGISALPGPSMSQGASQDASQGGRRSLLHTTCVCPYCNKVISNKYNLKTHILDKHTVQTERFPCELCGRVYSTKHSLATHMSTVHRGDRGERVTRGTNASSSTSSAAVAAAAASIGLSPIPVAPAPPPPPPPPPPPGVVGLGETRPTPALPPPPPSQGGPVSQASVHNVVGSMGSGAMPVPGSSLIGQHGSGVVASTSASVPTPATTMGVMSHLVEGTGGMHVAPAGPQLPPPPQHMGSPSHEQIHAMAQSLAQSLPSFSNFPGLE
ncbi:uncharacterized protein LOC143033965 isoform X3 [Oratosquilla oratoria]|uniref:uncharacterized protein LOC143033965 isoform X3 n=1 Tax=Oratosquilla oratoria TaxID=337810 RepID=UPI003F767A47